MNIVRGSSANARSRISRWHGLFLTVAAIGWAGAAAAMPGCEGTFSATLLHPLPVPSVVALDVHDPSPANQRLAGRFLDGLRDAKVTVGEPSNVQLHFTTSQLGGTTGQSGFGQEERSYSEMSGLEGGVPVQMAPMPTTRMTAPRPAPTPPLLILRVDATTADSPKIAWVASLQCRRTDSDDGAFAQQLGRVIGGALGQRIDRRPL